MRSRRPFKRSGSRSATLRQMNSAMMSGLEQRLLFATFTVTNLNDGVAGSLRDAVNQANSTGGADTIDFQSGLNGTITLTAGELALTDSAGVTIQGPGSGVIAVSGNDASRVFNITSGTADISGLTITQGRASGGGNIFNSSVLNLSNSVISNGATTTNGGGIDNQGTMTITDCTIRDNGGLGFVGGGIFNGGTLTVIRSAIRSNRGVFGAGISNFGNLTVTACSIFQNQGDGLRTQSQGSGIYRMIVRDSTIINNTAAGVFGLANGDSRIVLLNSTIALNETGIEAGEFNDPPSPSAWITAVNCTVSLNETGVSVFSTAYTELANTIVAANINTDVDGTITSIGGNFIGGNPMLDFPDNYGGPTATFRPKPGSPVINAGNSILARYFGPDGIILNGDDQPLAFDQRGTGFDRISGGPVDIGSFEVQSVGVTVATDPSAPSGTVLRVQGTGGNDTIALLPVANSSQIEVTSNSVSLGLFSFSGRVIVQGSDGDDVITIDPRITRDVIVFGGIGNDTITTGRGDDVLVGGDGADRLFSLNGSDILIGGNGEDHVEAGNGQDILIGGRTSYDAISDANIKALDALSDSWSHSILYPLGIIKIGLGIGPNHPYKLNASTVFDDGVRDQLIGGSGLDWFFGNFSGSGVKDTVNRGILEVLTDL